MIVEKQVIKAADAKQYINEFGSYDEELVWIDRMENRALCDTMNHGTGHITEKEWKVASGN
jgi:hypothetical protein